MLDTTTTRPGRPEDLPTVAAFWMAMFEEVGILNTAEFSPGWERRFVEYFTQRIAAGSAHFALAVDGGRIVGTAGAMIVDGYPSAIHGLKFGYIFGVRVEPEFRGRGLATALTQDAAAFLRRSDCRRIRLHASTTGRPIYERLGFVPTNEMELP